ncbi:hypothetical protein ACTXT7_014329, partial [Hymenolepis weldensis]
STSDVESELDEMLPGADDVLEKVISSKNCSPISEAIRRVSEQIMEFLHFIRD